MLGQRILLLIPHPDDEVVGCCAAIGRAKAAGAQVSGFYLTTGVPAAELLWPWERRRRAEKRACRRKEAERAAEMLGIGMAAWQDIPTRQLKSYLPETARQIERLIDKTQADMLWTPAYEGGHQDHDAANFLASRLRKRLCVWEFSEYNYAGGRVRAQEFPLENEREIRIVLNPSEQFRKRELLGVYASERGNLAHTGWRREVFRPLVDYDYTRPPHEGKLFYQRYQWVRFHPRIDQTRPDTVCAAFRGLM